MTTKADLQKENDLLRGLVPSGNTLIQDCHFEDIGGVSQEVAEAVKEIAIACQLAAKALGSAGTGSVISIGSAGELKR